MTFFYGSVCRSGLVHLLVGRSVCLSLVSPAKVVGPTEIQFGLWTWVGPRNHVLDGDEDPPWEGEILRRGKGRPIVKYRDILS